MKVPGLDCDVSGPGGQELVPRPRQLESVGGRLVSPRPEGAAPQETPPLCPLGLRVERRPPEDS